MLKHFNFQIYGQLSKKSPPSLTWSHSYSKVFPHFKSQTYDPGGSFLQFSSFDVENRPRVKCVSAASGVPITTQWDKKGYHYATQICQFALSHWSKAVLSTTNEDPVWLEDGNQTQNGARWVGKALPIRVTRDKCAHFDESSKLVFKPVLVQDYPILSFNLLVRERPKVTLDISSPELGSFNIEYSADTDAPIGRTGHVITFGYRGEDETEIPEGTWRLFTRNIVNDLSKGLALTPPVPSQSKKSVAAWTLKSISVVRINQLLYYFVVD